MDNQSLTVRAVVVGIIIGTLINVCNTYYGLRLGSGGGMNMIAGLLGHAIFKLLPQRLGAALSTAENVLIISVASSAGSMPLTAGLINAIPAIEFLIERDDNSRRQIAFASLVWWSIGLSFFGIIFAAMLRKQFVEKGNKPWPGAYATAQVIQNLHAKTPNEPGSVPRDRQPEQDGGSAAQSEDDERGALLAKRRETGTEWRTRTEWLVKSAVVSGVLTIVIGFLPILHNVPIFGNYLADEWLWTIDLSPGVFGGGMIMGPIICTHMLIGAIVGWGILSPYAKYRGWAPGEVDDWTTGSRGWIIWVSLASLLADATVKIMWLVIRPIWNYCVVSGRLRSRLTWLSHHVKQRSVNASHGQHGTRHEEPLSPSDASADHLIPQGRSTPRSQSPSETTRSTDGNKSNRKTLASQNLVYALVVSIAVCTGTVHFAFGNLIKWYFTPLAVALSLPMAAVGILSIAETDYNPESAILSQLVFAALVSHTDPNAVIINLLSAALAVAGASQAGILAYDLKVGSLVGASPQAQVYGQTIGSIFGAVISCATYRLYTSRYTIPGPLFKIPSAWLLLSTSRLLLGRGLPDGVLPFVVAAAVLSATASIVKMRYERQWWQNFIPSGVAFAIGIYLAPCFSIMRAAGGYFYLIFTRYRGGRGADIIFAASGLILGESVASLVNIFLS